MSTIGVTEVSFQEKDKELPETLEMKMPEGCKNFMEMVNSSEFSMGGISDQKENTWTSQDLSGIRWSSKRRSDESIREIGLVVSQKKDKNGKSWIVTINSKGIAIQG